MRPAIRPETSWRFPDPDIHRLPNGQEVWVFNLPGQHVAAIELVIPVPLSYEPRLLEGVASIALSTVTGLVTLPILLALLAAAVLQ